MRSVTMTYGGFGTRVLGYLGSNTPSEGASVSPKMGSKSYLRDILKIDGRRNRRSTFLAMIWVGVIFIILAPLPFLGIARSDVQTFHDAHLASGSLITGLRASSSLLMSLQIFLLLLAGNIFATLCLLGQRFRDMGLSGKWAFLAVVPYVNLGILATAFLVPTWPGANAYGPDPRTGQNTGRWT
ncbi:MAG: DUF805 domain-containing protein [Roseibium sp.]|uniref:DUF805 domain-containing protein n=1 Tax=Roseibium sp. TaxID=1936156 RepID=UPI00329744D0